MSPNSLAIWAYFWPLIRILSGFSVAKQEPKVESEQSDGFEWQPEAVKFEPEGFESQQETCKTKLEGFESELEIVKLEPEVEMTRLDASTQCREM